MIAQRYNTMLIDAVEIDEDAYQQSRTNLLSTTFEHSISVYLQDIKLFQSNRLYDYIVCNPPFFGQQLRAQHEAKNKAWHDASLTLQDLIKVMDRLLQWKGLGFLILPLQRFEMLEKLLLRHSFFIHHKVDIRHQLGMPIKYSMIKFARLPIKCLHQELIIRDEKGNYTTDCFRLLSPYYTSL
jgi:Predicted O-methyltransferase